MGGVVPNEPPARSDLDGMAGTNVPGTWGPGGDNSQIVPGALLEEASATMRSLSRSFAFVAAFLALAGCAAETLGSSRDRDPDRPDGDECVVDRDCVTGLVCDRGLCLPPIDEPTERMDCDTEADCPTDYTCEDRGAVRICIPPPVDGPSCGHCPFPNECRDGVCIPPSDDGDVCEFDPECGEGMLCIAGRCTTDPRIPLDCVDAVDCPEGLICSDMGECICTATADCPVGTLCRMGMCLPDDGGCVGDDECPMGMLCEGGECRDGSTCDVVHPDLSTPATWEVASIYNFREALPSWLSDFLDAVAGPFRFLAGDSDDPDLGLPGFIEDAIGSAIRRWAEDNLPPYALSAMGGIADLNDILSTWIVDERMELTPNGIRDGYQGTHEWVQVSFEYRDMRVIGRPEDIVGWTFEPEDFQAQAVCGVFNIDRHPVEVGIGAIIAWAVDAIVYEASDHRYRDTEAMLNSLRTGLCSEARRIADGIYDGAGPLAESWCNSELDDLATRMIMALDEALLRLNLMRLKGHSPIVSGTNMEPGVWEGSLVGGDFSGSWSADR